MKLSEILKDWPEKRKETEPYNQYANIQFNSALTSCDREIDREALAKALYFYDYPEHKHGDWYYLLDKSIYIDKAQAIISTMPTWLKRSE